MAKDINIVCLSGNLAADPQKAKGDAVFFNLATKFQWKDGAKTSYVRIGAFNGLSKVAGQYLKKGGRVTVTGRIETSEYMKDGIKKYGWCVIADQLSMEGKGKKGDD